MENTKQQGVKRFFPYMKYLLPVKYHFIGGLLAGVIAAAASGAGLPMVIKYLVPFVTGEDAPEGIELIMYLCLIPTAFLFRAAGTFINSYYMAYAGLYVLEEVRLKIFTKLQHLPLSFYNQRNTGDLMARVSNDTQTIRNTIITVVNSIVKEPATLLSAAGFLIYLSIEQQKVGFLLIALASVPCVVFPIRIIGKKIYNRAKSLQFEAGRLNDVLNENFSSAREVRAYNLQDREITRFMQTCEKIFKRRLKLVKYQKSLTPIIEFVTSLAIVFALYVATSQAIPAEIIASILTALYLCYQPIKKLGAVSNLIAKAEASVDRMELIMNTEDTVPDTEHPTPITTRFKGNISFKDVSFSYTEHPVLNSINATVSAGEIIALVGPSGAGKSTFANLVPRFYDVDSGSVEIDGVNVKEFSKHDLREQIAIVSQEAILFDDTIAGNIRIGKASASDEDVERAARLANSTDFIEGKKKGFKSKVGERGSKLSGGQRQRISIARAFLKDAPIIILDEPTSALDAESEHKIQAALEELSKGRTVLIIAHRFSTIQHADRILVFDAGNIVATGTHNELYASNNLYKSLYDKQSSTALESDSEPSLS